MDTDNDLKDEVLARADRLLYYNNLLIEECNGWFSAEESNRNMEKRIAERKKKEKGLKISNISK
jgi:hypothetical protein